RDQERGEKWANPSFPSNRFFLGFAADLDFIGVKLIEDFKILLEAFADIGMDDSRVQGVFPGMGIRVEIVIQVVCGGDAKFVGHCNSCKVRRRHDPHAFCVAVHRHFLLSSQPANPFDANETVRSHYFTKELRQALISAGAFLSRPRSLAAAAMVTPRQSVACASLIQSVCSNSTIQLS